MPRHRGALVLARNGAKHVRQVCLAPYPPQVVLKELAALGHRRSHDVLTRIYGRIEALEKRRAAALAVAARGGPHLLHVLALLAAEEDFDTRMDGLRRLRVHALIDFEENPEAYPAWRERMRGKSANEARLESAREFALRLRTLSGEALHKELRMFDPPRGPLPGLRESGLLPVFEELVQLPLPENEEDRSGPVRDVKRAAWEWIKALEPDEEFLRRVVVPVIRGDWHAATIYGPIDVLARSGHPWVFDVLIERLDRKIEGNSNSFALGTAFATLGDRRAIPHLIAAIAADPKYETVYGLGYFGLGKLTGVRYDESHDGNWWLKWWDENRDSLPPEVRAIDPRRLR